MTEDGVAVEVATLVGSYGSCADDIETRGEGERSLLPGAGSQYPDQSGSDALIDLRPLKRAARHLADTDPVRQLIEGEPDFLPSRVLAAKADSWVLLLLRRGD